LTSTLCGDGLNIHFIYSNKTIDDILVKNELAELENTNSHFKLYHTITRHNSETHGNWEGLSGRVSKDFLIGLGFPSKVEDNTFILVCGPKGM